jgi:hypothetical protein
VALPHEEEIKAYLRLTTEVEDDLIEQINMSAQAWVRAFYYVIDQRTAYIDAKRFEFFSNPPYDVEVAVGWENHPEYDADIEPILRQAILWAASTYYRNRNVGAIYEQSGGQVSITYTEAQIPPLLRSLMESIKDTAWYA